MDETQVIEAPEVVQDSAPVDAPVDAPNEPTPLDLVRDAMLDEPQYERGPDGKFIKKQTEAKAEPKPEDVKKDALEEPLPEGTNQATQERFQKVIANLKEKDSVIAEKDTQLQSLTETIEGLTNTLQSHGVNEQVFSDMLTYTKAVTSGDVNAWYQMLSGQVRNFEIATGRQFAAPNPLSAYPDLAQAVQGGQVAPEYALQLANARDKERAQGQHFQTQQAQQQQTHQQQQQAERVNREITEGVNKVAGLVNQWKSSDLHWGEKAQKVAAYAEKIASNPGVSPAAYADLVAAFYENLQASSPMRQASNVAPLRPAASSSGPAIPTSPLDAVRMAVSRS